MSRASSAQAAAAAVPVRRSTTLFVDGLAESFASGDLTALFAQYGEVVEGEVFVDNHNVSRGFGFVTMRSTDAAARAKAELDLKTLPGVSPARPLKVRWALDKGTLYVGDLGPDVTGDQLQEVRRDPSPNPNRDARTVINPNPRSRRHGRPAARG
jgi:RNA recognition motif-containing protein